MKRLLATGLLLLACAWTGHARSQSIWDGAALPDSLRAMIHLNSADLPPFPKEDSTLVDPHQWPDSVVFLNRWYYLDVQATQYDLAVWGNKRVIRPGWALYLGYSRQWKTARRIGPFDLAAGPAYSWNEKGRLWRRTWYEPDTVTYRQIGYVTRPSGTLFIYSLAEREADPEVEHHLKEFAEYFGRDGELLGFSYKKTGERSRYWWNGRPESETDWDERYKQLWREVQEEEGRRPAPSTPNGAR